MPEYIAAVYEHGNFVPESPCHLPEGAKVLLAVHPRIPVNPPLAETPEERARLLRQAVERMKQNPLPAEGRRYTRDEMHDRG